MARKNKLKKLLDSFWFFATIITLCLSLIAYGIYAQSVIRWIGLILIILFTLVQVIYNK